MTKMNRYFVKDMNIECPRCGAEQSLKELIDNGEFDEASFEQNSEPGDFNPFDNSHPDWGRDRQALPFICHCSKCGEYIEVHPVLCIFAVDIYDRDLNVIKSEYTERIA